MAIRRALLLASAERYIAMSVNLATTVMIARLLRPEEFGLAVLGLSIWTFAEGLRELGITSYLVQQPELTIAKIRTSFTIVLMLTLIMAGPIVLAAPFIARFYGAPELENYFYVIAVCFFVGPFVQPIHALWRREMAFATIASLSALTTTLNAGVTIFLAYLGFSFMSFAWASLVSTTTGLLLYLFLWRDLSIFRFSLSEWRGVVSFGVYDCGATALYRLWDTFPYLMLGRILGAGAVGLYQRATMLCNLPERLLLAGMVPVVLPAFSDRVRRGQSLKEGYLRGIEYITAVLWPALLILVILAHPIVSLLLGPQWSEVAPLVQVMAGAMLFWFQMDLTAPILMAAGAVRHSFLLALITVPFSICTQSLAAPYGLYAVALTMFINVPVFVLVGVFLVRLHVPFHLHELAASMRKSAVVALLSAVGPLAIRLWAGASRDISIAAAVIALVLSAVGWVAGLWLTGHPFLSEALRARDALVRSPIGLYVVGTKWYKRHQSG
jgi:O-antigen/teichoic acid export membrane protein